MQAVVDSLEERPTQVQVQEAAAAATRTAAASLQQQVGDVTAELEAVKARLRGAGQDLQQLKDWQVGTACWWCVLWDQGP
jgi:phage shock protein A